MFYVGIDQSLNATGLCILQGRTVETLLTISPAKLRDAPRLAFIRDTIAQHLERVKEIGPVYGAMEGYAYEKTGRVFQLGEVGGVVRLLFHDLKVPLLTIPPTVLKKFATQRGAAKKEQMIAAAIKDGARPLDDNQADAYFLALISEGYVTGKLQDTREKYEVLNSLNHSVKRARKRVRRIVKFHI